MMLWLNKALVAEAEAHIHPADRGFTLGDGLFETLAVYNGAIAYCDEHLNRLRQGCAVLQIPLPTINLMKAMTATVAANHLTDAVLRLTLTRGVGARGVLPPENLTPTLVITANPLPPQAEFTHGVIIQGTRRNEFSPLSRIKALPYLDNILALQEAVARGGNEAILLNSQGLIAESSHANIFVVKNGEIMTPPVNQGALPGIIRAVIMKQRPVTERSLTTHDLYQADEVFLTNSLGIRPVSTIDNQIIGHEPSYPITEAIRTALEKIVS